MSNECLRQSYRYALQAKCEEQSCAVNLKGIRNRVILKGEALTGTEKVCDCFFFLFENDQCTVALIELKGKDIDVGDVVEKFKNSTRIASEILRDCGIDAKDTRWYHFLYSKELKTSARKKLDDSKVSFKERQFKIIPEKCDKPLREAIDRLA